VFAHNLSESTCQLLNLRKSNVNIAERCQPHVVDNGERLSEAAPIARTYAIKSRFFFCCLSSCGFSTIHESERVCHTVHVAVTTLFTCASCHFRVLLVPTATSAWRQIKKLRCVEQNRLKVISQGIQLYSHLLGLLIKHMNDSDVVTETNTASKNPDRDEDENGTFHCLESTWKC
jgi:hypothetical protein